MLEYLFACINMLMVKALY